ncbi:hypothetical protein ACRARG_04770 [Pseudooceanicola sp. C21-150M6]|uniref:hypothetical protein n=1 Tax=Pseudooceanicola sp. C21-150M6 TaxID=3434355 RepID=UPI003D7FDF41
MTQLSETQKTLLKLRMAKAVADLNEVLADTYRHGMFAQIHAAGDSERPTVSVEMRNPVEMKFEG